MNETMIVILPWWLWAVILGTFTINSLFGAYSAYLRIRIIRLQEENRRLREKERS